MLSQYFSSPSLAVVAVLAAVDDAADADQVADLEARHMRADRRHAADDLVARHARVQGARPFGAHLMEVRVAHAAEGDLDLHVVRARLRGG